MSTIFADLASKWKTTQRGDGAAWLDTRRQLHWAVQFVGQAGERWGRVHDDYRHLAARWDGDRFVGEWLTNDRRVVIDPSAFAVGVEVRGGTLASHPLVGSTWTDAAAWLADRMPGASAESFALDPPTHDMPDHAVRPGGAPFTALDAGSVSRLAGWFSNADAVASTIAREVSHAGAVRVWPHHFDLATLITFDTDVDAERARSIGVGMSPGDGSSDDPYWYVNVWPIPESPTLPGSPGAGRWQTDGWVGAVLAEDTDAATVATFVDTATATFRRILGV